MDTNLEIASREPIPESAFRPARSPEQLQTLIEQLRDRPGQWFVYSKHRTRGSARQRVLTLRGSATFRSLPVQWRTMRETPGDPTSEVQVLVRWQAKPQPVDVGAEPQNTGEAL